MKKKDFNKQLRKQMFHTIQTLAMLNPHDRTFFQKELYEFESLSVNTNSFFYSSPLHSPPPIPQLFILFLLFFRPSFSLFCTAAPKGTTTSYRMKGRIFVHPNIFHPSVHAFIHPYIPACLPVQTAAHIRVQPPRPMDSAALLNILKQGQPAINSSARKCIDVSVLPVHHGTELEKSAY